MLSVLILLILIFEVIQNCLSIKAIIERKNHLLVLIRTPTHLIYTMISCFHLKLSSMKKHSNYDHPDNETNENICNRKHIENSKYLNVSFNGIPEKNQLKYSRSLSSKWYNEFPWLHYNLDKDVAFCYTSILAEIKGLKTICYDNDEAFITRGYRNWHHATEKFRVHKESDCHNNYVNQPSPAETVCYVDESFDETLICQKARSRQIFLTVLRNIQFLSRQGLTFQGNNKEGDFEYLMTLSAESSPRTTAWMKKKQEKYLHHDTQNKIIRLMTFVILRDIGNNINDSISYSIMANELTDCSN